MEGQKLIWAIVLRFRKVLWVVWEWGGGGASNEEPPDLPPGLQEGAAKICPKIGKTKTGYFFAQFSN